MGETNKTPGTDERRFSQEQYEMLFRKALATKNGASD